jgi:hypothetical protein
MADSLSLVPETVITWRIRLEQRHSLETTLVEVKDEKLRTHVRHFFGQAQRQSNEVKLGRTDMASLRPSGSVHGL